MTTDVDVVGRKATRPAAALGLLQAARPKQWVKNLLVFAAPIAGGVLTRPHVLAGAVISLAVFTLSSAGGYLLNDALDAERDRSHPDKCKRPVASGALSAAVAASTGAALVVLGPLVALAADRDALAVVVGCYSAVTFAYGIGLKGVPGLELVLLSSGFVLRPIAGAVSAHVPPSAWFLAVCCLAAVTIGAGKRQVELQRLGWTANDHRPALTAYSVAGLRRLRTMSLALMMGCYVAWALTRSTDADRVLALLSAVPVAVAMHRLSRLNDAGAGDAPEAVLLSDRWIQLAVLAWAAVFVLGLGRV